MNVATVGRSGISDAPGSASEAKLKAIIAKHDAIATMTIASRTSGRKRVTGRRPSIWRYRASSSRDPGPSSSGQRYEMRITRGTVTRWHRLPSYGSTCSVRSRSSSRTVASPSTRARPSRSSPSSPPRAGRSRATSLPRCSGRTRTTKRLAGRSDGRCRPCAALSDRPASSSTGPVWPSIPPVRGWTSWTWSVWRRRTKRQTWRRPPRSHVVHSWPVSRCAIAPTSMTGRPPAPRASSVSWPSSSIGSAAVRSLGGDASGAIEVARRRVDLDPLDEPGQRRVMDLLARSGDRAGAIRQYRSLVALFDRELGVAPLHETDRAVRRDP